MKTVDVIKIHNPLERLLYWITERAQIRLRRNEGRPWPWTDDEILQTYRFCNVRRMDDYVSRWLLLCWYKPYRDHPNTLAAAVLARHFNLPDALEEITRLVYPPEGGAPDLGAAAEVLRQRRREGHNIFNAAYMVRGIGEQDKVEMVINRVVRPLVGSPPTLDVTSMEACAAALLPYWGLASFMAGQVVADLRWALTGAWADRLTWAPPGPGSRRGLNRLQGLPVKTPLPDEKFQGVFREVMGLLQEKLPHHLTVRLEAMDYQNCLCEFDKYERALWGQGRPKQLYRSPHEDPQHDS